MNLRNIVIGLLAAVLVATLYYTYYIVPSNKSNIFGINIDQGNSYGVDFIGGSRGNIGVERFMNPAALDYKMGEYSNIQLKEEDKINYDKLHNMHNEPNELINVPEACDSFECQQGIVPSVDGCAGAPKSAAMFKFNRSSPECCPSTYSTSSGCVCLTDKQKNYISYNRGNNK